jgi:hypothetical protein
MPFSQFFLLAIERCRRVDELRGVFTLVFIQHPNLMMPSTSPDQEILQPVPIVTS